MAFADEDVHSFEKLSVSDNEKAAINRVIVANRREPSVAWSTCNQASIDSRPLFNVSISSVTKIANNCFACCSFGTRSASQSRRFSKRRMVRSGSFVEENQNDTGPFSSNEWRTSKYTLFSFLPKNMFEQFRRLANFYFLTTAILQLVIPYSPVGPTTSFLPLIFVVTTTAIKQAYEDYLRHRLDNEVNNRTCYVLKNQRLVKVRSRDIRVGDIVCVKNNEEIPCDMVLLAAGGGPVGASRPTSEPRDRCYVTTVNLDGETSLKSRTCFIIKNHIGDIDEINNSLLVLECEQPNATLYEFNGVLRATRNERDYRKLVLDIERLVKGNNRQMGTTMMSRKKQTSQTTSTSNSESKRPTNPGLSESRSLFDKSTPKTKTIINYVYNKMRKTNLHIASTDSKKPIGESMTKEPSTNDTHHLESSSEHVEIGLDISNLLLRASRLKNTSHVYGLVVHTGKDTKLAHNSQVRSNKFSSTEAKVNMFLLVAFLILICLSVISAILYKRPDYWFYEGLTRADSFVEILLAHFLLYNYIVPISLYVTLEFIKFFGTLAVIRDKKLTTMVWKTLSNDAEEPGDLVVKPEEITSVGGRIPKLKSVAVTHPVHNRVKVVDEPKCNSSDLNEDLGQIEVLFTDKTGTLTENVMQFMACSVRGQLYRNSSRRLYQEPSGTFKLHVPNVINKLAALNVNRYAALGVSPTSSIKSAMSIRSRSREGPTNPAQERPFDHRHLPSLANLKLADALEDHEMLVEFFVCLCLCSTVAINETLALADCLPDKLVPDYQSASPDERSLIEAASWFGVTLCKSSEHESYIAIRRSRPRGSPVKPPSNMKLRNVLIPIVETKNSTDKFIVRHFEKQLAFEFNSTRKRMSVIYKDCDNSSLLLVMKGSEIVLDCVRLSGLGHAGELQVNTSLAHFEAFSKSGLRTMLVANKLLDKREFSLISDEIRSARIAPANREQLLEHLYRRVESNLNLVGTTAVEDTLQEQVPQTIANLKKAGVLVWLLTGDKVETAVSVAYSCKLLDRDMSLLHLVKQHDANSCRELLETICRELKQAEEEREYSSVKNGRVPVPADNRLGFGRDTKVGHWWSGWFQIDKSAPTVGRNNGVSSPAKSNGQVSGSEVLTRFALIIDGRSLHYAMKYAREELELVTSYCVCVLGCRLSPLQKAEVVEMVKQAKGEPITAAIGDGANDVSMIQAAHVGIGISGREGRQAVNSSDFAIRRFHMLSRLLFVHGHLFYHRTANTILYFFYKNLLFIFPQFLYTFYNLSSAASVYHPIMLIGFNLLFTSGPILLYGLSERHLDEATLASYPRLYSNNKRNKLMRYQVYFSWLLLAVVQAVVAFYLLYFNFGSHRALLESGKMTGLLGFELALFYVIVNICTLKLYFLAKHRGLYFNVVVLVSLLLLPLSMIGLSLMDTSKLLGTNSLYHQVVPIISSLMFWLAVMSTTAAAMLPDIIFILQLI